MTKKHLITIQTLSHDGRGIGTDVDKKAFVSGALPNEEVAVKVLRKRSTFIEAEAIEIIKPSPERREPPCPHFGLCGGCSLQHMPTDMQVTLKQQTLLDQLKHFGHIQPARVLPPLTATTIGYRRKARLGVKFVIKKDKMLVGFREKSSRYLADLDLCKVLHPRVGLQFESIKAAIADLEAFQSIPQIEVAIGDNDVALVIRHMNPLSLSDRDKLIAFGKMHDFDLYLQPNSPLPLEKLYPDTPHRLTYTLPDYGLEFLFHPLDFTQINLEMNRLMVKQAIELLDIQPTDRVLDLFCGIGNFTLPMAKSAQQVTGVEGSDEMVKRGYDNAAHNHITNVNFYAANLMDTTFQASWFNEQYDKILLDPPRAGAQEIINHINRFNAKKIVYVSCNPATLARDAGLLKEQGYRLVSAGIMNMFPHTAHIEAMAEFVKE